MAAVLVGVGERDLHVHRAAGLEHDRRVQGQLVERRRTDVRAGVQRQLDERRAGHDGRCRRPRDRPATAAPSTLRRPVKSVSSACASRSVAASSGCSAGVRPAAPRSPGATRRRVQPVALALEGVGRQAHALPRRRRRPAQSDGDAVHVGVGQRGREALEAAVVAAQRPDRGAPRRRPARSCPRPRRSAPGAGWPRRTAPRRRRAALERAARTAPARAGCGTSSCASSGGGVDQPAGRASSRTGSSLPDGRDRAPGRRAARSRSSSTCGGVRRRSRPGSAAPETPSALSTPRAARRAPRPRRRRRSLRGPLTAAIESPSPSRGPHASSASAARPTTIPPCPASALGDRRAAQRDDARRVLERQRARRRRPRRSRPASGR